MLAGVGIVCFAASYAVSFVLELTRLVFRSGIRGAVMVGFAAAGWLAHTIYLINRSMAIYRESGGRDLPLSSKQEWCFLAAWLLVGGYLYLTFYHPRVPFGLFILPLVLGLIGAGWFVADPRPFPREPASKVWGLIHGTSILLATVAVLAAFGTGLMYLSQDRRLKKKSPPSSGLRLPSLERLREITSRALVIALLMMGLGILSGMLLNFINHAQSGQSISWSDPVVVSTLAMFCWLWITIGVGAVYRPAREGRKMAYLTLVSFVFLVIALASVLWSGSRHGGSRVQGAAVLSLRARGDRA